MHKHTCLLCLEHCLTSNSVKLSVLRRAVLVIGLWCSDSVNSEVQPLNSSAGLAVNLHAQTDHNTDSGITIDGILENIEILVAA